MSGIIGFFIGLFVGALLGFMVCAFIVAVGRQEQTDEKIDKEFMNREE